MSWERQSDEKVVAFFKEFPFMGKIVIKEWFIPLLPIPLKTAVRPKNTYGVRVSRVNLDLVKERGNFSIFDEHGSLIGQTHEWQDRTLQDELMRIDRSNVGFIVEVDPTSPSYYGYGLLDHLTGNYALAITVYKPPTDFDLAHLPEELARRAKEGVDREVADAQLGE